MFSRLLRFKQKTCSITRYAVSAFPYWLCRFIGRPYFGAWHSADQSNAARRQHMARLAAREQPCRVLEIGTWGGGSAILWATHVPHSLVYCIDPWRSIEGYATNAPRMRRALRGQRILKLLLHNLSALGLEHRILLLRGTSAQLLPMLTDGYFCLVYVDGDHRYEAVSYDLDQARRLVREGGLLCGDDLELQLHEIDADFARASAHEDYVRDPKTGQMYHPGVTLAVAEKLGTVSAFDGFWVMRKTGTMWAPFSFS
jgi:predicted O-methyltransferase YrrM